MGSRAKRAMLLVLPLCALHLSCAETMAGVGLDPDISIDFDIISNPIERKAAIEKALKKALDAVKVNPNSYDANMELGKIYRENGDNQKAVGSYSMAIKLDSGNIRGYRQRSMTYFSHSPV